MNKRLTIVAFGDSTTAQRVHDGKVVKTYSEIIQAQLSDMGIDANVINKGIPGNNTEQAMLRFNDDVILNKPDIVIIQFGLNDAAVDVWKTPAEFLPRVARNKYIDNLAYMLRACKRAGMRVLLMTPNPMCWTEELRNLYGKLPYDVNDAMGLNVILDLYVQGIRNLAKQENVEFLDIYKLFVEYEQSSGNSFCELLLDGMHPNDGGHLIIGKAIIMKIGYDAC